MLGAESLVALLGCADGITVDLDELAARASAERVRLNELLRDACARIAPGEPISAVVRNRLARHGTFPEIVMSAQRLVDDAREFVRSRRIAPFADGDCIVEETAAPRRWGVGRISWSGSWERPAPARFHLTPPDRSWPPDAQDAWLRRFGCAALPALAVHETFPGHANHALAMRHVASATRRTLWSELFFEGWAHYCKEMCLEEGFQGGSPELQAGVALESLVRLTRIDNAIGLHTHQFTVTDGARLFSENAFLDGPAAMAEAQRGLFEPTYTRYGVGKFFFLDLRETAKREWGQDLSLERFHTELLSLGSPPLGPVPEAMGFIRQRQSGNGPWRSPHAPPSRGGSTRGPAVTCQVARTPTPASRIPGHSRSEGRRRVVWDVDGTQYLDLQMGNGSVALGYARAEVDAAVVEAIRSGVTTGVETAAAVDAAESLAAVIPNCGLIRFANTGTEALMHATAIARFATGRALVAKVEGAYNGWYDPLWVSTSAPGRPARPLSSPDAPPGSAGLVAGSATTVVIPFNDVAATSEVLRARADQIAAVVIEPVMIDIGYIPATAEYLIALREITRELGIVLIFDELLTGFRIAPGGAREVYGIQADLSTYGKAIANGYPIAVVEGVPRS